MAELPPAPAPDPRADRRAASAVALCACAAYATSFAGGFQFDDWRVIVGDPRVQSLSAWWRSMPGIRPLLKLTYALNQQCGMGLPGFHAVNLAIHAASAVLAFHLLARLGRRLDPPAPRLAAVAGALAFALHPVQTEAVTYLSGRSSSLSGALLLASALAFAAGRDAGRAGLVHLTSPLLMLGALSVKEGAAALPAALLLIEVVDRRRPFSWAGSLRATSVHLALALAAGALFLSLPAYRGMMSGSLSLRPFWPNLLTHARATAWLAGQLLPVGGLVADPDLLPVVGWPAGALVTALVVVAAGAAGLLLARRQPVAAFAIVWFLCWLAPQGWWLPRPEPASERQLYLAILGPAWWLGMALARIDGPLAVGAVLAGALALGAATAARSLVYRDEVAFWSDVVEKAPGNARAQGNLGYALALACRPEEAAAAFDRAVELDPGNPRPLVNRRLLGERALLPDDAERRCRTAEATRPAEPIRGYREGLPTPRTAMP